MVVSKAKPSLIAALALATAWIATGCTPYLNLPSEVTQMRADLKTHIDEERAVSAKLLENGGAGNANDMAASVADLRGKVDQLQDQVQSLNQQVEELISMVGNLSKQPKPAPKPAPGPVAPSAGPADLPPPADSMVPALPSTSGLPLSPAPSAPATATPTGPQPAKDHLALYNDGYRAMTGGDLDTAITIFQSLIDQFQASDLADNAMFWIGECYIQKTKLDLAEKAFGDTASRFPSGNKVPDALYKQGWCQLKQNKTDQAVATWRNLVSRYPGESAGMRAKQELQQMGR